MNIKQKEPAKTIVVFGQWFALIVSVFVIFFYGSRFGQISNQVYENSRVIEQHTEILNKGSRWTREDHQNYEMQVNDRFARIERRLDERLKSVEIKLDRIYMVMINDTKPKNK